MQKDNFGFDWKENVSLSSLNWRVILSIWKISIENIDKRTGDNAAHILILSFTIINKILMPKNKQQSMPKTI